jgi:5-methylcytosine-specific restriction endonuclease McrA
MTNTPNYKKNYRMIIWKKCSKKCFYCSKKLNFGEMTIDHILPKSRGGSNHKRNKVAACAECNSRKGNLLLDEFYQLLREE